MTSPGQATPRELPRWWNGWPAALCATLLYAALALSAARGKGLAYDELGHVTAGASFWLCDDFRLQPENGNLPERLAGLPVVLSGARFPSLDQAAWRESDVWALGRQLFFELGNDHRALLLAARACVLPLGMALALLVYLWSRALFGPTGGLLSVLVFALSPALLAHGALATSDMATSLALLGTLALVARVLQRVTPGRVLLAGLATGALFLCKASALLLLPVAAVLVALRVLQRAPLPVRLGAREREVQRRMARALVLAGSACACALVALLVVWGAYGFRYAAMSPEVAPASATAPASFYSGGWAHIEAAAAGGPGAEAAGPALSATLWLRAQRLLPEAWLYGVAFVLVHSTARASFLDGEVRYGGAVDFFPRAFAYKTPLGLGALLLLALAAARGWRVERRRRVTGGDAPSALTLAPLLLLIAAVWIAALTTPLNIGHRHLLPAEAPLCVLAGGGAWWLRRAPRAGAATQAGAASASRATGSARMSLAGAAVVLALGGLCTESLAARPDYLGFFNALAGGPRQGWRHLVDSSLDWGQDLPGLAAWLQRDVSARRPPPPVFLAYFGKDSPQALGIDATLLPGVPDSHVDGPLFALTGGLYCISATMLWGVYTPVPAPWSAADEQEWVAACEDLRALDAARTDKAHYEAFLAQRGAAFWTARAETFQWLRFARLCAALRAREPDRQIGHSILVWELSDADVQAALYGPPPEAPSARR